MTAWKKPRRLEDCHNIDDLRLLARLRLPSPIFHHIEGGAEAETTLRRNTAAFDEHLLIPRSLVDVSAVSTSLTILGRELAWPVFCAPTGATRFSHPAGELAVARAAAAAGTLYGLSTMSTYSLEEVAAVSPGPKLFQLYVFKDRGFTRDLIERCKRSGYHALCLTVDVPVTGKRERDLRTGWGIPIKLTLASTASFASHVPWLWGQLRCGRLSMPNVAAQTGSRDLVEQTRFIGQQLDPSVSWKDVAQMIELWGGPFAIKGILAAADARRAADVGATALIVSNHGGRQLDGAVAPIDVLPQIAEAIGHRVEVILDGGIRRGVHVLKALARGAKACSIGRAYLYGLAAAGEPGVMKALNILKAELIRAMQLCGCTDVNHIDPGILRNIDPRTLSQLTHTRHTRDARHP